MTGNLPSWPIVRRGEWVNIEADLYRDGDEDDHEALSRDFILPDGSRLIVGRDVEVLGRPAGTDGRSGPVGFASPSCCSECLAA